MIKRIISKTQDFVKKAYTSKSKSIKKPRLDKEILNVLQNSYELQQIGHISFNKKGRQIVLQNVFHAKNTSVNIYLSVTLVENQLPTYELVTLDLNGKQVDLQLLHNSVFHILKRRYEALVEYLLSSLSIDKIHKMEALEEQGIDGVIHLSNYIKL